MTTTHSLAAETDVFRAELVSILDRFREKVKGLREPAAAMRSKVTAVDPNGPDRSDRAAALGNLDVIDGLLNAIDPDCAHVQPPASPPPALKLTDDEIRNFGH
jgi:hypothetical protein